LTTTQQNIAGVGTRVDAPEPSRNSSMRDRRKARKIARRREADEGVDRRILSPSDWHRPGVKWSVRLLHGIVLVVLIVAGIGPLLMLARSAITPTQDILEHPIAFFTNGVDWSTFATAWNTLGIWVQFLNTIWVSAGEWIVEIIVATTAGYALSVLQPRYGKVLYGMILATLFIPIVVILVPLYLVILHPPLLNTSMINTWWAVWLPAGASAFNVVLVKRFFDNLPREVFEAARTDGAGSFRLFWSIVLPMSKPILGVVSIFAIINAWKDYLWPLIVLQNPAVQPLSVRLPALQDQIQLNVYLAALAIATVVPIIIFLVFQRFFLRGAGLGGAVKG
jgi:multiple sugar transport system permease protein